MKISALVIAKDEEKNIKTCLDSVNELVFEKIVIDTGSTDNTIRIAKECGAEVYTYEWNNNFADARNFALSKAKGDWIIFLDADESLERDSIQKTKEIINLCHLNSIDFIYSFLNNYDIKRNRCINSMMALRIFRNDPHIRYQGAIHEVLTRTDRKPKTYNAKYDIKILHIGYTKEIMDEKNKGKRNLDLLLSELEKKPRSSNICHYITEAYMLLGNNKEALKYAYRVIEYNNSTLNGVYKKNLLNILQCMIALRYPKDIINATIDEALHKYPDFPDFYLYKADMLVHEGRYHDAINSYKNVIQKLDNIITSQSSAHIHLNEILFKIGKLSYQTNQLQQSTTYLIEVLKSDKYHFQSLYYLMKMFNISELYTNIINFFAKIYDYSQIKDILILLKASLQIRNNEMAKFFFSQIHDEMRGTLKKEKAMLDWLDDNLKQALKEYKSLYLDEYKNEYALKAIALSLHLFDKDSLLEISQVVKPSLKRICESILNGNNECLYIDRLEILNVLEVMINFNWINIISLSNYFNFKDLELEQEIAKMAFEMEDYSLSYDFYNRFLNSNYFIPNNTLSEIYGNMAYCRYRNGQVQEAISLFEKSLEYDPLNYKNYVRAIELCLEYHLNDLLRTLVQYAKVYFKDSEYINELEVEVIR